MAKIITIILLTFVVSISFAQQYTPMTAAGYQMKRLKVDSTLHIPSFCGVPTTRNSTAKEGAVAMDTCNNLLYIWTNLSGWSSISGGTIVDTAAINAAIALRVKYSDTAGMLQPYLRKIDTLNKWVQSVTKLNDSTIRVVKNAITTDLLIRGNGVKYSDTAAMLSKYLRKTDTASLSNRINLKLNLSDTATMLSKYLRKTDTASLSTRINLKLNISDTSSMLSKYLRKTDTASLSTRINTKLSIADTVNKWVQDVTKLNDSTIRVRKNNTNTDIVLPKGTGGSGGSQDLQSVTTIGDSTTNSIRMNGGDLDVNGGQLILNESLGSSIVWYDFLGNTAVLQPKIPNNQINYLPDTTGTLVLSVNGNFADSSGNITLSTGSGTVTSITQGYGIKNSPNPIVATGTVTVDTSTGGLSGKYVRISDTATILLPYLFGSGTPNYVPKFNTSRNLGNSLIYDNATSVGISTSTPNASWKLDVNGIINTNNGVNIATNGAKTGFYGNANTFDIWAGNNKIATWGLANVGGTLYDHFMSWVYTTGSTGESSAFRIASGLTSTGTNNASLSQLLINPSYAQQTFGTGTLRGIYYNPIIGTLNGSTHIAFESTSGNVVMKGIKKSSSTTDSIAIWINDTLSKAPYPSVGGTVYVDSIYRTKGKDSIFYKKNGNTYAIKDSVGTNPAPVGYYGAFQDTTIQVAAAINTPYAMKLGVTDLTNAVTIASDGSNLTRITIANTGIYNIQFSAQFDRTNSGTDVVDVWLRKNGINVAGSGGKLVLAGGVVTSAIIATWNYVLDVTAGDYYQLMWSTPDTHVRLLYETAQTSPFVHPLIPSLILTVTQQSGIMAGTGITAINSLTGAAQTMVTGTDSTDFKIVSTGTSHTFNLPTASATKRGALSSYDWSTFNGKIGAADTSVFQRKNIAAYSFMANNTASAANVTPLVYKDLGEQVYAGTITWTFTGAAPSGTTTLYYRWTQVGKTVNYNFYFYYTTASTTATAITFDLPTDMPTPQQPTGSLGTNSFLYKSNNIIALNQTGVPVYSSGGLRKSASGYEWNVSTTSGSWRWVEVTGTYFVN